MTSRFRAAVIGGGPAGLMAAEVLATAGIAVDLYDAMPTFGRKLLMAGRGGLNLTHSEGFDRFLGRYGDAAPVLRPALAAFDAAALRGWAAGLGVETFVGSSGRVFPKGLKASPLLRVWLGRLGGLGVAFHPRHRWTGFAGDGLVIQPPAGDPLTVTPDVTVLALGGASWPRLGSDGAWAEWLGSRIEPFRPANGGFLVDWSPVFRDRWAGTPLKTVALSHDGVAVPGEAMVTAYGIEGGAVYALGRGLRQAIERDGGTDLLIDLKPGLDTGELGRRLAQPRRGASLGNFLRKAAALPPVTVSLLREAGPVPEAPAALAATLKQCRLRLTGSVPLARAISTAGGVAFDAVDAHLMLNARPDLFVAGEMLDWEAPTGGYLLQACFATGRWAALGALARLRAAC